MNTLKHTFFAAIVFAALSLTTSAKELPDMPEPKSEVVKPPESVSSHPRFYSGRVTKITLAVEVGAWATDMAYTCRNLGVRGGTEDKLPVHTCGQAIAITAGFHAAGEGLAYLLHRTGHHKLEQIPRWYLTGSNIYGAAYSASHYWPPAHAYAVN